MYLCSDTFTADTVTPFSPESTSVISFNAPKRLPSILLRPLALLQTVAQRTRPSSSPFSTARCTLCPKHDFPLLINEVTGVRQVRISSSRCPKVSCSGKKIKLSTVFAALLYLSDNSLDGNPSSLNDILA